VNAYVRSTHFSGFGDDAIFTWIVETLSLHAPLEFERIAINWNHTFVPFKSKPTKKKSFEFQKVIK
jgi:hypothetical protein